MVFKLGNGLRDCVYFTSDLLKLFLMCTDTIKLSFISKYLFAIKFIYLYNYISGIKILSSYGILVLYVVIVSYIFHN